MFVTLFESVTVVRFSQEPKVYFSMLVILLKIFTNQNGRIDLDYLDFR